ncbi:protein of unknown function [Nitrospira defluvii]|uniref:Uncharacterized protein n=1 Tax=Nitrospira defluvii TaxID=330214 RepID=D8PB67_9BACT|nr:protein of unknown function [Nitrospira defluvii]
MIFWLRFGYAKEILVAKHAQHFYQTCEGGKTEWIFLIL